MNRFNRSPSAEYRAFVEAVKEYAGHDHEPGEDVRRAIADALEDELRERFKDYWEVDETADTACLRRVITGEDECSCDWSWVDRELETIGEGDEPPHKPPHSDHASLWLDEEGEPVVFSMHVYHPEIQSVSKTADPDQRQRNGWFDIVRCIEHWGLEIAVMPVSWYNAFSTVNIVFYLPDDSKLLTDEHHIPYTMTEIVATDDTLGGAPRIKGRRIGVHHITKRVLDGDVDPEQVAAEYDLNLADVYRAITYYYDHPDEIREIRRRQTTPPEELRVFSSPEEFERREKTSKET